MKIKRSILFLTPLLVTLLLISCEKKVAPEVPTVETSAISNITGNTATGGGNIIDEGSSTVVERGIYWSTRPPSTSFGEKTEDGSGAGSFTSNLTNLKANTTYYVKAYATNDSGTGYGKEINFKTAFVDYTGQTGTVSDVDNNTYPTIGIGGQIWMAVSLKTTNYSNGTSIPLVTDKSNWLALTATSKAYCWYNDDIANKATYGALYTWAAAMNGVASTTANPSGIQGVCPTGWHLPSDAEWSQMENYLADNGYNYDGTTGGGRDKIAKSLASTSGWTSSSNTGAVGNTDYPAYRNKSDFTALPGGYRIHDGTFLGIGYYSIWWSATEYDGLDGTFAWSHYLHYSISYVRSSPSDKNTGFSVRCVRD